MTAGSDHQSSHSGRPRQFGRRCRWAELFACRQQRRRWRFPDAGRRFPFIEAHVSPGSPLGNGYTGQAGIGGARQDLPEHPSRYCNLDQLEGDVQARITTAPLEAINTILDDMRRGKIVGRMVLKIAG
jgi:hypothetical protein